MIVLCINIGLYSLLSINTFYYLLSSSIFKAGILGSAFHTFFKKFYRTFFRTKSYILLVYSYLYTLRHLKTTGYVTQSYFESIASKPLQHLGQCCISPLHRCLNEQMADIEVKSSTAKFCVFQNSKGQLSRCRQKAKSSF